MRTRKLWNGLYHCGSCQLQEELLGDETVECGSCGERLRPGPLFDEEEEGDEEEGEDEEVGAADGDREGG